MGLVPKTTKSDIKIIKGLTLGRLIGFIVAGGMGYIIGGTLPYGWLQIVFSVTFIIIFFIASGKAPTNPTKSFAHGLMIFIQYLLLPKKLYGKGSIEYKNFIERKTAKNDKNKKAQKRKK